MHKFHACRCDSFDKIIQPQNVHVLKQRTADLHIKAKSLTGTTKSSTRDTLKFLKTICYTNCNNYVKVKLKNLIIYR